MDLKGSLCAFLLPLVVVPAAAGQEESPPPAAKTGTGTDAGSNVAGESKAGEDETPAPAFDQRTGSLESLRRILAAKILRRREEAEAAVGNLLEDLAWSYAENRDLLEKRFQTIAARGPLVTELLLEKVVPKDGETASRNLSRNVCIVLRRIADPAVLPDLVGLLGHENRLVRANVVYALRGYRDKSIVTPLLPLLDDPDERVRLETVETLGSLRAPQAGPALAAKLFAPEYKTAARRLVAWALAEVASPDGADKVLAAFDEISDSATRYDLVRYFEAADVKAAAPVLFKTLSKPNSSKLEEQIIRSLGYLAEPGDRAIIGGLRDLLKARAFSVASAAAISLYRLKDKSGLSVLLEQPQAAIEKSPRSPYGYLARARVYAELEEWHRAAQDFKRGLDKANRGQLEKKIHFEYAECFAAQKQYERAARVLRDSHVEPEEFAASSVSLSVHFDRMRQDAKYRKWFVLPD